MPYEKDLLPDRSLIAADTVRLPYKHKTRANAADRSGTVPTGGHFYRSRT